MQVCISQFAWHLYVYIWVLIATQIKSNSWLFLALYNQGRWARLILLLKDEKSTFVSWCQIALILINMRTLNNIIIFFEFFVSLFCILIIKLETISFLWSTYWGHYLGFERVCMRCQKWYKIEVLLFNFMLNTHIAFEQILKLFENTYLLISVQEQQSFHLILV